MRYLAERFVAGFVLLLPVILSYLLLGALFDMLMVLTTPIVDLLPLDMFPDEWVLRFTAAAVLVLLCLAVGIADRSTWGKRAGSWLETRVLSRFAPYAIIRALSRRLSGRDAPGTLQPALLSVGPGTQMLAYVVEAHRDGKLTMWVPLGSTPGVGHVQIVEPERVERVDAPLMETLGALFNWGSGTAALIGQELGPSRPEDEASR